MNHTFDINKPYSFKKDRWSKKFIIKCILITLFNPFWVNKNKFGSALPVIKNTKEDQFSLEFSTTKVRNSSKKWILDIFNVKTLRNV